MKLKNAITVFVAISISLSSLHFTGSCYADKMLNAIAADNYKEFTDNGLIYNIYDDHVELVGHTEDIKENVVIPDVINNTPVTIIAEGAFEELESLESVTISENVTAIEDFAFCGCKKLEKIEGIKNVKSIGCDSFSFCEELKELTLPTSIETIGEYAFNECKSLNSIILPDSVTDMGAGAFFKCEGLVNVKLSNNLTELKTDIDESQTPRGYYGTFGYCSSLKEIEIPESVIKIGECTFEACSSLERISISKNVTEIGGAAFQTAKVRTGLKIFTSPEEELECSLKEIIVAEENESFRIVNGVLYNMDCSKLIQYPLGVYCKEFSIPKSVKIIGEGAFYDTPIEKIVFEGDVEEIRENAFGYCSNLEEIEIPESVIIIGDGAFACTSLENIVFPKNLKQIGANAFANTRSLKNVVIPQNVERIGFGCFYCSGLESIKILNPSLVINDEDWMTGWEICSKKDSSFNGVIYGLPDSTAQKYAEEFNCKFELLDVNYNLGDINNNGTIDAVDASTVLAYYAMISTNKDGGFDDNQKAAADVDHDGKINAVDASNILSYYAYISTTKEEVMSMEDFMKKAA